MKIFISYSRTDEDIVRTMVDDLSEIGHDTWFDQALSGGQVWWDQTLSMIRDCNLFMFILSPSSVNSAPCKLEYQYAYDLMKRILPVLIVDKVSMSLLPPELTKIQHVDYRNHDRSALLSLIRSINQLPPERVLPDPLPTPPEAPVFSDPSEKERSSSGHDFTGSIMESIFEVDRISQINSGRHWVLKSIIDVYNQTILGFKEVFSTDEVFPEDILIKEYDKFEDQSIAVIQNKLFRSYDAIFLEITAKVNKSRFIFFNKTVYKYPFGIRAPVAFLAYFMIFTLGRIRKIAGHSVLSINYDETYRLLETHIYSGIGKLLRSEYDSYFSYSGRETQDRIQAEVEDYIKIFGFTTNDLAYDRIYHKDHDGIDEAVTTECYIDKAQIDLFKKTLRKLHTSMD